MGTIKRGILGGFSKKIANIVGGSWKGIAYMRSLPLSVANPRTDLQVTQRSAFAGVVGAAVSILTSVVKPLWDRFAVRESGYNAFVRANIKCWEGPDFVNFDNFVISQGKMQATPILSAIAFAHTNSVAVSFEPDISGSLQRLDDVMFATVYSEQLGEFGVCQMDQTRGTGVLKVYFKNELIYPDFIHVYVAAKRKDGSIVSETSFYTEQTSA